MKANLTIIATLLILASCNTSRHQKVEFPQVYSEDWESLSQNDKEPNWFVDAKLGIYFHWGIYSVPAYSSEWYPHWMYIENPSKNWGKGVYQHHEKTYGHPSEFNYHDFVPDFKAEQFDAADWADLFQSAGAKFAGPVAQHHDGFAMWDSKVNPWNCLEKGPMKNILGDLFAELKTRNMKTIATFHHARNLQRYRTDTLNWGGSNSHFKYHPNFATSSTDKELKYLYGNIEEEEFNQYWYDQIKEVVDWYAPDMIWFDSWLDKLPEDYLKKMVALQYNAGASRNQKTLVAYKQKDIPRSAGVLDIEQGGMKEMSPDYWLTDITVSWNSWCYVEGQKYKPVDLLLRNMIDVWSKKGIVLLNVSPRADGVINKEQRTVLKEMGTWLSKYGEAVYGTRTHTIFGYGKAAIEKGHFGGQSATIKYSADDVRFTKSKDGKTLFVFVLGMPDANKELEFEHILSDENTKVKNISVVGSNAQIEWAMQGEILNLTTPATSEMNEIATIFKVEF